MSARLTVVPQIARISSGSSEGGCWGRELRGVGGRNGEVIDVGGGDSIEVAAVRARGARDMTDASGREAQGRVDITTSVLWCGICNRTPAVIEKIG